MIADPPGDQWLGMEIIDRFAKEPLRGWSVKVDGYDMMYPCNGQ